MRSYDGINDILFEMSVAAIVFLAALTRVHAAPIPSIGYVVRADSGAVYLDLGEKNGASVGRKFEIYTEGPELTHPVTGEALGSSETSIAEGTIDRVWPLYSTGKLIGSAVVSRGMRARLILPESSKNGDISVGPRWKSPVFNFKPVDFTVSSFKGDGALQTAIAAEKEIRLYSYPPSSTAPIAAYPLAGSDSRILSLEAADIKGKGRAQLFVSYYDGALGRAGTLILEFSALKKSWSRLGEMPCLTRKIAAPDGKSILACQELVDDRTFSFSAIYPLKFNKDVYVAGASRIRSSSDWLYGQGRIHLNSGKEAFVSVDSGHRLEIHSAGKTWFAPGSYGQSSSRLRWPAGGARRLEFSPRIALDYSQGTASILLVKNRAKWGILSEALGIFNKGSVDRLIWDGERFKKTWQVDLPGPVSDIETLPSAGAGRDQVAVLWATPNDESQLWVFDL